MIMCKFRCITKSTEHIFQIFEKCSSSRLCVCVIVSVSASASE